MAIPHSSFRWRIPDQTAEELQAIHFPSDLTIVEIDASSTGSIASLDQSPAPNQDVNKLDHVDSSEAPLTETNQLPESNQLTESKQSNQTDTLVGALPIGPANKWAPVAVVHSSDADVLQRIDSILEELWHRQQVRPVEAATDVELLRRAYLDLAGRTPTVTEVRRFLKDKGSDRYERLVDQSAGESRPCVTVGSGLAVVFDPRRR